LKINWVGKFIGTLTVQVLLGLCVAFLFQSMEEE
jgi:hypothetical protein